VQIIDKQSILTYFENEDIVTEKYIAIQNVFYNNVTSSNEPK